MESPGRSGPTRPPERRVYGRYSRAWAARFGGSLPEDIRPLVRLAGRLMVEIAALEATGTARRHAAD